MDRLLARQKAIQRTLAEKHLQSEHVVLHDITSTYFEGAYAQSDLVLFGYNRDGKNGHEQVVLGLLCNAQGCPVGVEVFAGNTQDAATVVDKIQELRRDYGLEKVTFVGDRGMITQAKARELKKVEGLQTITALTHRRIVELLEWQVIKAELFDEKKIVEVIDPENPSQRYCLCRNPETAQRERTTRQRLLDLTQAGLAKMAGRKKKTAAERLGAQVGKWLARYKMGKFVEWEIQEGRLQWHWKEEAIAQEKLFDGCYIISADVSAEQMKETEVVAAYKKLSLVEVRPGGLVMFITSRGTMDKLDSTLRELLSERTELVGAIRLPNDAFKRNAGTEVTTDIVMLRKLRAGEVLAGPSWKETAEHTNDLGEAVTINEYFVAHPEMMLGRMRFTGRM